MTRLPSSSDTSADPIGRRELVFAALLACALALVMHWPLPLHLGSEISRDLGDPLVQAWQVAWGGHALAHQPLDFFQANQFYPLPDSLAFSDALIGYAPAGLVGDGLTAAVARYNLLFLFAYALAFFGAYLLARELGVRPAAATIAGAAFAYAPWRLEQDGHLHVISSGGIPLALFLLLRGYRRGSWGLVLGGWLVAAWQVSIGFTLGLQLLYLLLVLGAALGVWLWRSGRLRAALPSRPVLLATGAGVLVVAATGLALAAPYQRVLDDHPEARRTSAQVAGLSGPPAQFVAASEENTLWGGPTGGVRDRLSSVPEQTLFPGLAILALAIAGLAGGALPRRLRIGLGVGTLVCAVLSLGFHRSGLGALYPYRLLYELAPGWNGIRVPGRLNTLTSLGLALLAAGGAQQLIARAPRRRGLHALAAALLVLVICVEGAGFEPAPRGGCVLGGPPHPAVPQPPRGLRAVAAPRMHLPVTVPANRRYVLWSTDGFPRIVNGRASFDPRSFERLALRLRQFPDQESIAVLRSLGVRSVVLHRGLARGTPWADASSRPVAGLGIARRERDGLVIYALPSNAAADRRDQVNRSATTAVNTAASASTAANRISSSTP